jgi:hypothetical protein
MLRLMTTLYTYHGRQGPIQSRKADRGSFSRSGIESRVGPLATPERSRPGHESVDGRAHSSIVFAQCTQIRFVSLLMWSAERKADHPGLCLTIQKILIY